LTLFNLFLVKAIIYGILGYFVRSSLSATRGFDVGIAGIIVLSGYLFLALNESMPHIIIAASITIILMSIISSIWYMILQVMIQSKRAETYVLLAGLGFSGLATGILGYFYGPSIKSINGFDFANFNSVHYGLLFCGAGLLATMTIRLSILGMKLDMLDRDRQFAIEIGCDTTQLIKPYGAMLGLGVSLIAISSLFINGTSPTSGIHQFLIAAAVAILFQEFRLRHCLIAGCVFAGLETITSYYVSPSLALLPVFTLILISIIMKNLMLRRK